ncbi:MAG: FosX/FosE/FosI family fosfomycin resistance hydrolase [Thermodesulfobacteriota bacterium]
MIESISHITFIVKNVKQSAELFRSVFNAEEIYDSSKMNFSVAYEKFFLIGGIWIAIMEGDPLSERTYNHVAFKVAEADIADCINKIRKAGLEVFEGRPRIEGESRSVYFYDFDNHLFELHTGTLNDRLLKYTGGPGPTLAGLPVPEGQED